jgi:hypothetical protein
MSAMVILGTQTRIYDDNRLIGCQVNYIFLARICQGKLTAACKYLTAYAMAFATSSTRKWGLTEEQG